MCRDSLRYILFVGFFRRLKEKNAFCRTYDRGLISFELKSAKFKFLKERELGVRRIGRTPSIVQQCCFS